MKKFDQYSRYLQVLCRAEQQDNAERMKGKQKSIIPQDARRRICDWIENAIIDICQ